MRFTKPQMFRFIVKSIYSPFLGNLGVFWQILEPHFPKKGWIEINPTT